METCLQIEWWRKTKGSKADSDWLTDERGLWNEEYHRPMAQWYKKSDKNTVTDGFNACIRALGSSSLRK